MDSLVIAGYYGFGNAGDELILHALIERFRKENSDVSITVLSKDPADTTYHWNVQAVDRWRPWQWILPLSRASRFILGGGGLLQEDTGPWNHLYYLSLLLIAKAFGCQTEVVSLGVDPIHGRFNRFWTRFVLNQWVDTISVRDEESLQALKMAGVLYPIDVRPDPVFDLKIERPNRPTGRIALAVSPLKNQRLWSRGVAELCDLLAKRLDVSVDLLVFFPAKDTHFAHQVVEHCAFEPHLRFWEKPTDLLSWIPQYDLVIATRFHALVLAAVAGVPFVGWGSQKKVKALCQTLQHPYWDFQGIIDMQMPLEQILTLYRSKSKAQHENALVL